MTKIYVDLEKNTMKVLKVMNHIFLYFQVLNKYLALEGPDSKKMQH